MKTYLLRNLKTKVASDVELDDKNYITEGGEGKIYGKHSKIYKVYINPAKMIATEKMEELQMLELDHILKPIDIMADSRTRVGFSMKWIKGTVPLCKLFTNDFWKRCGVTVKTVVELIQNMMKTIKYIHERGFLIVDGNEFNYLVDDQKYTQPYFIDVDSYQTKSFPATAIMPSIRDHQTKGFNENTDWFSFAIVACQLYVGMHPFKGNAKGYMRNDLEGRMKDNISIFHKGVAVPSLIRDVDDIPAEHRNWFIELFEKGKRMPPPEFSGVIVVNKKEFVLHSSAQYTIELALDTGKDINFVDWNGNVFMDDSALVAGRQFVSEPGDFVAYSDMTKIPIMVNIKNGKVHFRKTNGEEILSSFEASGATGINEHLCLLSGQNVLVVKIEELGNKLVPVVASSYEVLPNATRFFEGMIYQDVLGVPYVILIRDKNGTINWDIVKISELTGYRIIEAKHDLGVMMLIGFKNGKYDRFIFRIHEKQYILVKYEDVSLHAPNFVTLANGVVVSINEDDQVEVFSNSILKPDILTMKEDPAVSFDMKLAKQGMQVLLYKGTRLLKFSMKRSKA